MERNLQSECEEDTKLAIERAKAWGLDLKGLIKEIEDEGKCDLCNGTGEITIGTSEDDFDMKPCPHTITEEDNLGQV